MQYLSSNVIIANIKSLGIIKSAVKNVGIWLVAQVKNLNTCVSKCKTYGKLPDLFVSMVLSPMLKNLAVVFSSARMSDRYGKT